MYHNYNKAVLGKHVASPPKKNVMKKMKRTNVGVACASIDSIGIHDGHSVDNNHHDNDFEVLPVMDDRSIGSDNKPSAIKKAVDSDVNQSVMDNCSLVTPAMDCPTEVKMNNEDNYSDLVSSLTCLGNDNDSRSEQLEMGIIPYHGVKENNNAIVTPHYNVVGHPLYHSTLSDHVQKNFIVQLSITYPSHPSEFEHYREAEEFRQLQERVKELEVRLSYEKEKNYEVLSNIKREEKSNHQITVRACVLL
jgi:hypothetical protein